MDDHRPLSRCVVGVLAAVALAVAPTAADAQERSLSFPLVVGAGFDGYYGPDDDASVHGGAGVNFGIPLTFIPSGYGRWALNVGGHVVVRDDDIRRLSTFDGDDNVIFLGKAALGFTY